MNLGKIASTKVFDVKNNTLFGLRGGNIYIAYQKQNTSSPMVRNWFTNSHNGEKERYQKQIDWLRNFVWEIKSVCCDYKRKLPVSSKEMKHPTKKGNYGFIYLYFFSAVKVWIFILPGFMQPTPLSKQMQRTISVCDTSKADSKCLAYQYNYFPRILSWLLNHSLCIAWVVSTLNYFEIPHLFTGI